MKSFSGFEGTRFAVRERSSSSTASRAVGFRTFDGSARPNVERMNPKPAGVRRRMIEGEGGSPGQNHEPGQLGRSGIARLAHVERVAAKIVAV
jgi:hypothetical protein